MVWELTCLDAGLLRSGLQVKSILVRVTRSPARAAGHPPTITKRSARQTISGISPGRFAQVQCRHHHLFVEDRSLLQNVAVRGDDPALPVRAARVGVCRRVGLDDKYWVLDGAGLNLRAIRIQLVLAAETGFVRDVVLQTGL